MKNAKIYLLVNIALAILVFIFAVLRPLDSSLPNGSMGFMITESMLATATTLLAFLVFNVLWWIIVLIKTHF